jgi:cystathionine beta-lyase family protein involved in aluminum resistance
VGQQALHGSELAKSCGSFPRLSDAEEEERQELKDVVQDRVDAVLFVFDGGFARDGAGVRVVAAVCAACGGPGGAICAGGGWFRGRSDLVQASDYSRGVPRGECAGEDGRRGSGTDPGS